MSSAAVCIRLNVILTSIFSPNTTIVICTEIIQLTKKFLPATQNFKLTFMQGIIKYAQFSCILYFAQFSFIILLLFFHLSVEVLFLIVQVYLDIGN